MASRGYSSATTWTFGCTNWCWWTQWVSWLANVSHWLLNATYWWISMTYLLGRRAHGWRCLTSRWVPFCLKILCSFSPINASWFASLSSVPSHFKCDSLKCNYLKSSYDWMSWKYGPNNHAVYIHLKMIFSYFLYLITSLLPVPCLLILLVFQTYA